MGFADAWIHHVLQCLTARAPRRARACAALNRERAQNMYYVNISMFRSLKCCV